MAAPTIGLLNHTSISTCESTTNFTTFDTLDSDIKKEGSNGITGTFRNDLSAGWYDHGSAPATAVDKHLRIWINTTSVPYIDTAANGGCEIFMYDNSTQQYITVFSSDDYFGGWFNTVIDCNLFTSLTLANVDRWGFRMNYTSTAKNIDNVWIDYIRYLDGYYLTGGSSSDTITLADVATADRGTTTLYGYGIVLETEGVYLAYGTIQLGNGTTTTYFEMDGEVLVFVDAPVADGLYAINGNGSGADILITGSTIKSGGTSADTRFDFDMSTNSPGTVEVTNNVFQRGGTFTFASGQTITGNSFTDCQQITPNGADMTGSSVSSYGGTAGTAALVWNVATDPDGYLDDMSFTKGTSTVHAIEFGSTSPSSITLRGCNFSGYNAANANNDSTFYVSDSNTGNSYTINCVGCTGNVTYRTAGASVTIVSDPVTVKVTTTDASGTLISSARVILRASDGTGPFPYQDTVTIVNSGTTATVTHTAHGMATNDKTEIRGASLAANNGVFQITVTGVNTYTYTMGSTPGSSPTGTITSTFVALEGLTVAGVISTSRVYPTDQPVVGWARKSSASPYYKTGPLSGTVDSADGYNNTAVLILDE